MASSSRPASASAASTASTRTSKACEACRIRRRKCDGVYPCSTCIKYGTGNTCAFRAKARPHRPPPVSLSNAESSRRSLGPSRSPILCQLVEDKVMTWAAQHGSKTDVRLSTESHLSAYLLGPTPALPGTPHTRLSALETFCEIYLELYRPTLSRSSLHTVNSDLELFWAGNGPPPSAEDQLVVLSAICLGTITEKRLAEDAATVDDLVLYRIVVDSLDQHALRYSFLALERRSRGDPIASPAYDDALGAAGSVGPNSERRTRFFRLPDKVSGHVSSHAGPVLTIRWFAALYDGQPLLSFRPDKLVPTRHGLYSKAYTSSAIFAQMTTLENRVMMWCSTRPSRPSTDSQADLLNLERELHDWRNAFRAEERVGGGDLMFYYGLMRYDWLRLILRFPLFNHTNYASASQTICSQAAADIIRTYSRLQSVSSFRSTWPETRRISTAGQVLLLCYIEGELSWQDFEPLSQSLEQLLGRIKSGCLAAERAGSVWRELVKLASPLTKTHGAEMTQADQDGVFTFDFSTPPVSM